MSILRITGGEYTTNIKENWTVYTEDFYISGQQNNFSADKGTTYGTPLKREDAVQETVYIEDGWWSSDFDGKNIITDAKVGETVYFQIRMKKTTNREKVNIKLFDYDKGYLIDDEIPLSFDSNEYNGFVTLDGVKGCFTYKIPYGIERYAENFADDEIQLYMLGFYETEGNIKLPKNKNLYLNVHTCNKDVERSFGEDEYGSCEFYQYRYNDFMRRHRDCGHVPPTYYYGPMLIMNGKTEKFYKEKALTKEMQEKPGMDVSQIELVDRLGIKAKPLPAYSYGFKYCVRFSKVLYPKLSGDGQEWLIKARSRLQQIMEIGVIGRKYEAKYDKVFEKNEGIFNINFVPTDEEVIKAGEKYEAAKAIKKTAYYTNIELIEHRFQEFAFATHPDAYDPKEMSELTFADLVLVGLTPDFREWMGDGSYATWVQAAIVAANMDYVKLFIKNAKYYTTPLFPPIGLFRRKRDRIKILWAFLNKISDEWSDIDSEAIKKNMKVIFEKFKLIIEKMDKINSEELKRILLEILEEIKGIKIKPSKDIAFIKENSLKNGK